MERKRCSWCLGSDIYIHYHDHEWGIPLYDDRRLFEMLVLEGVQAGLSWIIVLKKRDNYREAFDQFDPVKISGYQQNKIVELMNNEGIIRNKLKIQAAISNANAFLKVLDSGISFKDYIWQFVNGVPVTNHYRCLQEIPAYTLISEQMSKKLKKDGFKFVGKTIVYAYMQSVGMVNDHITDCFRHQEITSGLIS